MRRKTCEVNDPVPLCLSLLFHVYIKDKTLKFAFSSFVHINPTKCQQNVE